MNFLDVKTDYAFKKVFGSDTSKEILISFLEANLSKDELEAQHKRQEFISIQKLAVLKADEEGFEKGLEQGLEKGLEQGAKNKQIEIAKILLSQNIKKSVIALSTGLTIVEIDTL